MRNKERYMILVLEAMAQNPAEELYQQQIDSLILQQDSLLSSTHVRRRIVTHHNTYTIHHKPKSSSAGWPMSLLPERKTLLR